MSERQPRTPRSLERIVRRCLEKKPEDRWQSARDLRPALELVELDATTSGSSSGAPAPAPVRRGTGRPWLLVGVAALAVAIAVAAGFVFWPRAAVARVTRFEIPLPPDTTVESGAFYVRVSPDGSKVAFTTTGANGGIWVRDLASVDARLLPGTRAAIAPFWAPDSRSLAFGLGNRLVRVDASGGPTQVLAETQYTPGTGFWTTDGQIVFGHRGRGGLMRVAASGGVPAPVTQVESGEVFHALPSPLDGHRFLYLRLFSGEAPVIFGGSLDNKPDQQPRERIGPAQFGVTFVPGRNPAGGYLFFVRDETLMAQPFDPAAMRFAGDPMPVVQQIGKGPNHAFFSVTAGGVMAYRTGPGDNTQLTWVDRRGNTLERFGEPGLIAAASIAPDGKQIAILRAESRVPDSAVVRDGDIWLLDVARNVETRLTTGQKVTTASDTGPVWSHDGRQLAYASGTKVFVRDIGIGDAAREVVDTGHDVVVTDWTRDGRFLILSEGHDAEFRVSAVAARGGDTIPLASEAGFLNVGGRVSPDGRWMTYTSSRSGRNEVYVRLFAPGNAELVAAGVVQISRDGGFQPKWSADGKELFFLEPSRRVMVAAVDTAHEGVRPAAPRALGLTVANFAWTAGSDPQRFLLAAPLDRGKETPITVVTNWELALRRE